MKEDGIKIAINTFGHAHGILQSKFAEGLNSLNTGTNIEVNSSLLVAQLIPSLVMLSFSIELNLKLLLFQKTGIDNQGHNIKGLFDKLPSDVKSKIASEVASQIGIAPEDFKTLLQKNSDTFVDWRYFYEDSPEVDYGFLKIFAAVLKSNTLFRALVSSSL